MKSILVFALMSVVLSMGIGYAYAEVEITSIETENERVYINIIGEFRDEVFIYIWNESGDLVYESFRQPDLDGQAQWNIGEKHLQGFGDFTGHLNHNGNEIPFSFEFTRNTPTLDLQIDNSEEIQLVPQSAYDQLSQENERLVQENKELKSEIERLKDEIIKIQEDFFLTIKEQLNYFMSFTSN